MRLPPRLERALSILGFPVLLAAAMASGFLFRAQLSEFLRSPGALRAWMDGRGAWAPLAFMGLQAFQVIVFVVPGEVVQVAGGFAFGLWLASLWSTLGILAGSLVNFGVGRVLGRRFVLAVFGRERLERAEAATAGGKAGAGFFLLFVIPGIPKDFLTYVAGASGMRFGLFIIVSTIGRLPGIIGSSYMGAAVFEKDYVAAIVVVSVAAVLFFVGLAFRDRLHGLVGRLVAFLDRRAGGGRGSGAVAGGGTRVAPGDKPGSQQVDEKGAGGGDRPAK